MSSVARDDVLNGIFHILFREDIADVTDSSLH